MSTFKIDFGSGFDVTESPADEFNIVLDLSELTAAGELGGTLDTPTVDATHSGSAHHLASDPGPPNGAAGGELGGTYPSPTVDATHAGSTHHAEGHTIPSHSDTTATGAELEELTDGSQTALHSHAGGGGPTKVHKAADESVTSSTTLQNDDDFSFAISANTDYIFEIHAAITCDFRNGSIKVAITVPSGATMLLMAQLLQNKQSEVDNASRAGWTTISGTAISLRTSIVNAGSGNGLLSIYGRVSVGGTAGTVQLQWAQEISDTDPTTLKANSWMLVFS